MSLQFGRAGVSDGVTMTDNSSFTISRDDGGDDVTVDGWISAASQVDANALRQLVLGHLANTDEPWIPIVFGVDTVQSGYYEAVSGSTPSVLGVSHQANGAYGFRYSAKLRRIAGYSAPRWQSRIDGNFLTNDFGIVSANTNPWHAVPDSALGYAFESRTDTILTRTGVGGAVKFYVSTNAYETGSADYLLAPSDRYDMAATIRVGSTLRTVSGRQMVSSGASTGWELSNGFVKIEPATSGNSMLKLSVPVYAAPSGWGTAVPIDVGFGASGPTWFAQPYSQIDSVSIRHNSPELCVIRLHVHFTPTGGAGTTSSLFTVDISLRRGDRTARVTIKSGISKQWGVGTTTATAMSTITYGSGVAGMWQTTADANGNKVAFFTSQSNTRDVTNGRIYNDAGVRVMDVGLSSEVGGASAVSPDDHDSLIQQYFAVQHERARLYTP